MLQLFVVSVIVVVGVFDTVVGVRLLRDPAPYLVNGDGTLWAREGPALFAGEGGATVRSLFQRLGAFSLHTGVATTCVAIVAHDRPVVLACVLALYTLTGLAFFAGDRQYFRGTRYFVIKQALGAAWSIALVIELAIIAGA